MLKARTQEQINSTLTLINDAKNLGADLSEAEKIMDEVTSTFKAKDFIKAERLVKECQNVAKKAWTNYRSTRVNRSLGTAQQILTDAEKAGINVSKSKELLEEATNKIAEGDFEAAEELINKGEALERKKWNAQRQKTAMKTVEDLKTVFAEITVSPEDKKDFNELIEKIETEIEAKNFEAVNEYIKQAESLSSRYILDERLKSYSEKIQKSKELIIKTNEIGLDSEELEINLAEAEKSLEKREFENIDKNLNQIEIKSEVLFAERRKEVATEKREGTKEKIDNTREIGGDVTKAEDYFVQAEDVISIEKFDISTAENLLGKAESEANRSWVERKTVLTTNAVSDAKDLIQETKESGADVTEAESLLQETEQLFEDEDFELIDDYLKKVKTSVETTAAQRKTELVSEAVTSTKALLDETREMGADVSDAENILNEVEGLFKDEDFERVDEYVKKAEEALKTSQIELKREEKSKTISSTRERIDEGREKGAEVTEAEKLLTEAENMLMSDSDMDEVEQLIQQSQTSLASSYDQYKSQKIIDDISNMHGKIERYRSQGVDVAKAEEMLHNAEIEYKKENFDGVEVIIEKVGKVIEKDYDEQFNKKITLLINDVQNSIKEAKDMNLEVSAAEDLLKRAKAEFENKNYSSAEELANKANEIVKELIESFEREETQTLLDRVQGLIQDAKAFKLDVSPAERLFRQAKALFKANEYKSCTDYALKSENILNTLARKHIKEIHPRLSVELEDIGLQANKWNRLKMTISNDGQIKALDVEIGIKGDFEIKGKKKIDTIDPENLEDIEIGLNPKQTGELPLRITTKCFRPFDRNEYRFTADFDLKVKDLGSFAIQDVFLIYIDGCLIIHKTKEYREFVDEDIFSGMLVAVQNFVTDSFRRTSGEGLSRLDFSESKILIENGPKFFIALVMEGEEPGSLPLFMVETINEIQEEFGETLEDWDGNLEKLKGIETLVDKLLFLELIPGTNELRSPDNESTVMTVQSMIMDVQELGIDTTKMEKELKKAEAKAEESDYTDAMKHIEKAREMVTKARRDYYFKDVKEAIATVKDDISSAKASGVDTTEVEGIYDEMKDMVQSEAFPEVLEKAETVKNLVQESTKQTDIQNEVNKIDENLSIAESWGLQTPETEVFKEQLDTAMKEKDFDKAHEIINDVNFTLKESINDASLESIDDVVALNKDVDEVSEIGMNTEESKEYITTGIDAIKELDLSKANELFKKAGNKLSTDKKQYFQGKATESIKNVKHTMNELEKLDVNIAEATRLIGDAESKFDSEDFSAAHEIAAKVLTHLGDTSHAFKSKPTMDIIISINSQVDKAKLKGFDPTILQPIMDKLSDARHALEIKDYETAEMIARQASDMADDNFKMLVDEQDQLQAQLNSTMSLLSTSKASGMDTTEVDDLVGRMKEVLDSGDLESTKNYMESIQKTLESMQVPYKIQVLTKEVSKLEKYLEDTKEKGIDTAEAGQLTESAKTLLESEDLEAVEEYIKKARASLDSGNETHRAIVISETIQSTFKLISDVKSLGAEVGFAEELLRQAGDMLQSMNLDSAEDLVKNAMNTTQEVKKEFLLKEATEQINKAEQDINATKMTGLKTVDAERLLDQAKEYFKSEEFENSKQYALNAQQLIVDIKEKEKGSSSREELAFIQQLFDELKEKGVNVLQAEAPLMQAKASLNSRDYEMALTYIANTKQVLINIKKPFSIKMAKEAVSRANKTIVNVQNYGADVEQAQQIFNDAQNAMNNNDYDTAEEKAKKAEKMALEAQSKYYDDYISNEIKTLKENIDHLKGQGYDVVMAEELLSKVNSLYLEKNFADIGDNIKKIRDLIVKLEESKYVERANDAISFSKAMIKYIKNNIKNIGGRLKQPEKILISAESAFRNKEYALAEQTALESQNAVENIKHSNLEQFLFVFRQLQAEEMLNQTRVILSNVKKLGVDITESEDLVKQAEEAFKDSSLYNRGQELLTEAKIKVHEKENLFQEKNASSAISSAESLILTLRQSGVNVESANKFLNQAKTALEIKEFKKSILFAGKAKFTAKKLMTEPPAATTA
jgi:hypothetical protein